MSLIITRATPDRECIDIAHAHAHTHTQPVLSRRWLAMMSAALYIQRCPLLQEPRQEWQGRVTWYPTTIPLYMCVCVVCVKCECVRIVQILIRRCIFMADSGLNTIIPHTAEFLCITLTVYEVVYHTMCIHTILFQHTHTAFLIAPYTPLLNIAGPYIKEPY